MWLIVETIIEVIISINVACIYYRVLKRAFDAYAQKVPFPYNPLTSISHFMAIQIVGIVMALFLGSPVFQFTLDSFTDQLVFISIIIITIGMMRVINIIHNGSDNNEIVVWSSVAIGVLSFTMFNVPDFINNTLSKIIILEQQQLQQLSSMIFIGTFLISICVETIGWVYKKMSIKYG